MANQAVVRVLGYALLCAPFMAAGAEPIASVVVPGRAVSGTRDLPSEIRASCFEKGGMEALFVVHSFESFEAADSFFPFSEFEGPEGKQALLRARLVWPANRSEPATFRSGAAWFGVKNDFLFSLYAADAWRFVKKGSNTRKIEITLASGDHRLQLTYADPGIALRRITTACRK